MGQQSEQAQLMGLVKWFDPAKGFGFIVADETGDDVLLHANVLRNFGQSSVADGTRITFSAQNTSRGFQAIEIISIEPPKSTSAPLADFEEFEIDDLKSLPMLPARVKWFDKGKGFGFANAFGDNADIFIHIEVLRRSGLADLVAGEAVSLRIIDGKRGKMAAEVCPWESAQTKY